MFSYAGNTVGTVRASGFNFLSNQKPQRRRIRRRTKEEEEEEADERMQADIVRY